MIGMKDLGKLAAITVVTLCAAFVCTIFLNYKMDLPAIREIITAYQEIVFYEAQMGTAKVVVGVSGGCLIITTVILLVFYIKNYIDTHGKELGILKALGYSRLHIAKSFWVFGFSVLAGAGIGFGAAWLYLPTFYRVMNKEKILPDLEPQFHGNLVLFLVVLPTLFFMLLAVFYAYLDLNCPVLDLLKERKHSKGKRFTRDKEEDSFLSGLRKSTLHSRKILVFFVGFSAFCFSAMTQMSMAMDDLASEQMAWIMLSIGLILAFMTLLMFFNQCFKCQYPNDCNDEGIRLFENRVQPVCFRRLPSGFLCRLSDRDVVSVRAAADHGRCDICRLGDNAGIPF